MWTIAPTDEYIRARKWYAKKLPKKLAVVHDNLEAYKTYLDLGTNPLNANFGFLHDERQGAYAVDQKTNNSSAELKKRKARSNPALFLSGNRNQNHILTDNRRQE